MKINPLVSIIIVNWNGKEVLRQCLASLEKINYQNWELILVDNGSVDGSENLVENFNLKYKSYHLIQNLKNLGFAIANNQGLKKAHGKYILLLNNDTEVKSDLLIKLVKWMENRPTVGVIQPKILIMDKKGYLDNAGTFLTRLGFLEHWGYMKKDGAEFNNERQIFSAKGACMLCRKGVIDKVGLFDSDFFNYFEESDFCWRVYLAGFNVMYVPLASIYHKVGFSSKKQNQAMVNYHSLKNMMSAFIKNLQFKNLVFIGIAFILLNLFLSFYYLLRFRFNQALMIWKAIFWNLFNLRNTLNKRKFTQSLRKRSDGEIFKKVMHPLSLNKMWEHFQKVEANFK